MNTPEELKKIAEALYPEAWICEGVVYYQPVEVTDSFRYRPEGLVFNPLTNAKQAMEILKWLLSKGWEVAYLNGKYQMDIDLGDDGIEHFHNRIYAESLEQALINAALSQIDKG